MLSRAADCVFWMNRYIERAENYARFLDVNITLSLDQQKEISEQWMPLVETTGDRDLFIEKYGEPTEANVVSFLLTDESNPNSIFSCVQSARENARSVRETLSVDMWLNVNRFYLQFEEAIKSGGGIKNLAEFLQWIKDSCALHAGIMDGTLSHADAWHFGCLGRYLERADKTSRLLDIKYFYLLPTPQDVGSPIDLLQWHQMLRSASALDMFRRAEGAITPAAVTKFLILDPDFPRSVRFCLKHAEMSLRELTPSGPGAFRNSAEKLLGSFRSQMDFTDVADILAMGLHEYLDMVQIKLNEVGQALQEVFLLPAPDPAIIGYPQQ